MTNELKKTPMLTGLHALYTLIYTALHIPYLKDEKPVGILIISKPGMGKSMLLTRFYSDHIITINDMTGYGLERTMIEMEGKATGYIVNPDLLRLMARKKGWEAFLTLTNIILEEGLKAIRRADSNLQFKNPVNFGLISAITTDCFYQHQAEFAKVGFSSRFGIFSYGYELSDKWRIEKMVSMKSVEDEHIYYIKPKIKNKNSGNITIPDEIGEYIQRIGNILANRKQEPFRAIVFTRRMIKAHAFAEGRTEVSMADVKEIFSLIPFFLPPYPSATDLEYLILKETPEDELKKLYLPNEIFEARSRLIKKRIGWDLMMSPEELNPRKNKPDNMENNKTSIAGEELEIFT